MVHDWKYTDWESARAAYKYPSVRLLRTNEVGPVGFYCKDVFITPDLSRYLEPTDLDIENYHSRLFRGTDTEILIAIASIVFWGFFASSDPNRKPNPNRALERARWVLHGRKDRPVDCSNIALSAAKIAIDFCISGELDKAASAFLQIPNIGFSFASKLVMFVTPEKAAVYDSVIVDLLRQLEVKSPEFTPMIARISPTASPKAPRAYGLWCKWCSSKAEWLNDQGSSWRDRQGEYKWRAVDVERSLFQLGKKVGGRAEDE